MKKTLQAVFAMWEAEAKSWEDGSPEGVKLDAVKVPSPKTAKYNRKPVHKAQDGWNSLEKKAKLIPGTGEDEATVMQLAQEQDKLHKLEEELAALGETAEVEEGMITPDAGTSVLGRSLFTGAALQPPNGYGPNFDPAPPASEEVPPGYKRNTVPSPIAPEEGSGFVAQDLGGTIIAPRKWLPR